MKFGNNFVELEKSIHDRVSFDCGEEELNSFLKTQAAKHMKAGVSKTYVLQAMTPFSNNKYSICSYFTVAPSSIKKTSLPANQAKKLPHYPVPVFLLAQLAVHKDCQGQNLGKVTLIKALELLWKINSQICAFAIVVDCLTEKVERFYAKYGFQNLCRQNGKTRMYIPMKTVVELFK